VARRRVRYFHDSRGFERVGEDEEVVRDEDLYEVVGEDEEIVLEDEEVVLEDEEEVVAKPLPVGARRRSKRTSGGSGRCPSRPPAAGSTPSRS
jgi:hypothetical protein